MSWASPKHFGWSRDNQLHSDPKVLSIVHRERYSYSLYGWVGKSSSLSLLVSSAELPCFRLGLGGCEASQSISSGVLQINFHESNKPYPLNHISCESLRTCWGASAVLHKLTILMSFLNVLHSCITKFLAPQWHVTAVAVGMHMYYFFLKELRFSFLVMIVLTHTLIVMIHRAVYVAPLTLEKVSRVRERIRERNIYSRHSWTAFSFLCHWNMNFCQEKHLLFCLSVFCLPLPPSCRPSRFVVSFLAFFGSQSMQTAARKRQTWPFDGPFSVPADSPGLGLPWVTLIRMKSRFESSCWSIHVSYLTNLRKPKQRPRQGAHHERRPTLQYDFLRPQGPNISRNRCLSRHP